MTTPRLMSGKDWLKLLFLSFLWGGSFLYVAIAVKALPPFTVVFLRVSIAALALLAVMRWQGIRFPRGREAVITFLGMGLINNVVPFSLITWAQGTIPGGLASILNATTPLFTVLIMHFFAEDEKATGLKVIGVIIGFCGVATMLGMGLLAGIGDQLLPQLAMLGAATSYGISALWGRRFARQKIPPVAAATGQMLVSTALMLPLMVWSAPWSQPMPGLPVWMSILGLSLLATSLAYILFFQILASAGPTNLQLVTFLIPVSAILLGALVLGEVLAPRHFVGMAMIACGLAFIDGRLVRRLMGML